VNFVRPAAPARLSEGQKSQGQAEHPNFDIRILAIDNPVYTTYYIWKHISRNKSLKTSTTPTITILLLIAAIVIRN
jgi:hypothetical protein